MKITRENFRTILQNINNPEFVSMVTLTPEKMNQYLDYWLVGENGKKTKNPNPTVNPYYEMGVKKLVKKYKIITGFDYEMSINRRLEKEGKTPDFESQKPVWFEMISKGLVTDRKTNSKFYFRYQHLSDSTIGKPEYIYNGDPIEKQLFESYMTKVDYENQYSNQGLDNTLNFQVCDLNNILEMTIGGIHYELTD